MVWFSPAPRTRTRAPGLGPRQTVLPFGDVGEVLPVSAKPQFADHVLEGRARGVLVADGDVVLAHALGKDKRAIRSKNRVADSIGSPRKIS